MVETPSRATAGAHYTPKSLATEVVQYALEPLVYDPGPHQQVDGWVPVDSDRILELKVADIACGSGAFLVAAARYLADRLVEAWDREEAVTGLTPAELKTHAIRTVIATCLYGADINAMAVEMCKLSLWLVSLDPKLPFSFVDDKILHGNSLLGLTDVKQLKLQHIDPDAANTQQTLFEIDVDGVLRQAARLRLQLASEVNNADPQRSVNTKRRQWHRFQEVTAELTEIADAVVAAGLKLGGKPGRALNDRIQGTGHRPRRSVPERRCTSRTATSSTDPQGGAHPNGPDGLRPLEAAPLDHRCARTSWSAAASTQSSATPRSSAAQKLTGAMGTNIRDWFVNILAEGEKGQRRPGRLLLPPCHVAVDRPRQPRPHRDEHHRAGRHPRGRTRSDGRARIHDHARYPESFLAAASANLEYAAVWGTRSRVSVSAARYADDIP